MSKFRTELHWGRLMKCYTARPANVDAMIRQSVALSAEQVALVDGACRLTYCELDRQADAIAGAGKAAR